MIQTPMEFYEEFLKVAKPYEDSISSWTCDMQCRVTPQTTALVNDCAFAHLITQFRSVIDGEMWYEIPWAYKPWWDEARKGGEKVKRFDLEVSIKAKAFRVEAETEEEAKGIVYDACKNHDFLVIEKIFSEVIDEKEE